MRLIARLLATLTILLGATAAAARADTFTYSFDDSRDLSFSLTSPTLITTATGFTMGVSCSAMGVGDCLSIYLDPVQGEALWTISAHYTGRIYKFFPIPPSDFLAPGNYTLPEGDEVRFSIVDNPSSVTPEPSSLALLGTGALAGAEAVRRRYLKA